MLVFWKERLVLLAVPKTGTTALEEALGPRASLAYRDPPPLKHSNLQRYRRFVEPLLKVAGGEGFETVAVVREPVSWLSSWFRYRARPALDGHPNSTVGVAFDDFVAEWLTGKPRPFAAVGGQSRFVLEEEGPGVTYAFAYEQPEALHAFLRERLGDMPALRRANVSPVREATLSPGLVERIRRKRPEEFAAWARASGR